MKTTETIPVYIRIENGKTVCICKRSQKKCTRKCDTDEVIRDKFLGWEATMKRNRFGE